MSYLALYRKYRPKTFGQVIGQEHITVTLGNSVLNGKVGHAYLLTGSRGTGKTSVARIFARSINCLSPSKDGSPCGKCKPCKTDENLDIIEIDAASNNSVDEIRDLRDKVKFMPINGKFKVYIIDEVHMLSSSAFNALLKTLEEPPEHTIFILATTEVHKLPATILSRCMRFDFRLIPIELLITLLKNIFADIGQKASEEAVSLIASSGAGSVRDTLSIADICHSFNSKSLTYEDVLVVLGASDPMICCRIAENIFDRDLSGALIAIDNQISLGKSVSQIAADLVKILRDTGIIKAVANAKNILALPSDRYDALKKVSEKCSFQSLSYFIDVLSAIEQDLRYGISPRIVLENAILKCINIDYAGDLNSIVAKVERLEKELSELKNKEYPSGTQTKTVNISSRPVTIETNADVLIQSLRDDKENGNADLYSQYFSAGENLADNINASFPIVEKIYIAPEEDTKYELIEDSAAEKLFDSSAKNGQDALTVEKLTGILLKASRKEGRVLLSDAIASFKIEAVSDGEFLIESEDETIPDGEVAFFKQIESVYNIKIKFNVSKTDEKNKLVDRLQYLSGGKLKITNN